MAALAADLSSVTLTRPFIVNMALMSSLLLANQTHRLLAFYMKQENRTFSLILTEEKQSSPKKH